MGREVGEEMWQRLDISDKELYYKINARTATRHVWHSQIKALLCFGKHKCEASGATSTDPEAVRIFLSLSHVACLSDHVGSVCVYVCVGKRGGWRAHWT